MEAEGLTPEQAAADRHIAVEAVREAIEYVRDNRHLIDEEIDREERVRRERGLLESKTATIWTATCSSGSPAARRREGR